jgi:hypothetical protein
MCSETQTSILHIHGLVVTGPLSVDGVNGGVPEKRYEQEHVILGAEELTVPYLAYHTLPGSP